jgi:predicted DNA-binding protein (UPF0251 family)
MIAPDPDPERATAQHQIQGALERAIDDLPEPFRTVFVMRDIEEVSTEETATLLGIRQPTVKTRLYRARRMLRAALGEDIRAALKDAFPFERARCDCLVERVLVQLGFLRNRCHGESNSRTPHFEGGRQSNVRFGSLADMRRWSWSAAADLAGGGQWNGCRRQEAPWSCVYPPTRWRRSLCRWPTHIRALENHPRHRGVRISDVHLRGADRSWMGGRDSGRDPLPWPAISSPAL